MTYYTNPPALPIPDDLMETVLERLKLSDALKTASKAFFYHNSAYYISQSRPDYKDMAATLELNGYTQSTSEVDGVAKFVK